MQAVLRRITVAVTAAVAAVSLAAAPVAADTAVGVGAGFALGGNSFDIGFEQVLESALDSQFVGIDVAIVRGHLVLEGYASPGVHSAVLAIVAHVLQNPIPVPVGLSIISPNLGLDLPFLAAGAGVEIPDLGGLIRVLGVVDKIRVAR